MIASDHSPSPPEMKVGNDAFAMWGGISGCQHLRAALFTGGTKRKLVPADIARLTAGAVASRFRIPNKGKIVPGFDADLGWGAMQPIRSIAASEVQYRHPGSPWDEIEFNYRHLGTMLRGTLVYRGGVFPAAPRGRFIRPGER
jgi:allantoinase